MCVYSKVDLERKWLHNSNREGATQEDDGYLITFVVDKKTNESECVLLDAKTMSSTPIARMKIPQKVPVGFHGAWLTEEQIKDQQV